MSLVLRWIRRFFLWLGPTLVLLLIVACSFLAWSLGTESGTSWVLRTAVQQVQGEVSGIEGSIWRGVRVQRLAIKVPVVDVQLENLYLQVDWRDLTQRRLHAKDLSVDKLSIDIAQSADEAPSSEPFKVPALPIGLALDRIALGELDIRLNGEPILLNVRDLMASLAVTPQNAQLVFRSLQLGHDTLQADIEGELKVLELADPWPLSVRLKTHAKGLEPNSPLCVRRFLPTLPTAAALKPDDKASGAGKTGAAGKNTGKDAKDAKGVKDDSGAKDVQAGAKDETNALTELGKLSAACAIDVEATIAGDLDRLDVVLVGDGQEVHFDVNARLLPRADFPLQEAAIALKLADGSSLDGKVNWDTTTGANGVRDHVAGWLRSDKLNLGQMVGPAIPAASITTKIDFDAQLADHKDLLSADVKMDIAQGSSWNKQPLSGTFQAKVINTAQAGAGATPSTTPSPTSTASGPAAPAGIAAEGAVNNAQLWKGLQLAGLKMDLRLGKNVIQGEGELGAGDSRLNLKVSAARLADFWPDLPGGIQLQGKLGGSLASHTADLTGVYSPENGKRTEIGKAPVDAHIAVAGGWGKGADSSDSSEGWRGKLTTLAVKHAGMSVQTRAPMTLAFLPAAVAPAWQWEIGAASIELLLPSRKGVLVSHKASRGGAGRWETQGSIDQLAISRSLIQEVQKLFNMAAKEQADRGSVKLKSDKGADAQAIVLAADWNLKFAGTLQGQARIKRLSGDLIVPGEPDFPLGLQVLTVDLAAKQASASASRLTADINVVTAKMGRVAGTATALLRTTAAGGFALDAKDTKTFKVDADIQDLGWVSLLAGDAMEVGGSLTAHLQGQSRANGTWATSGTASGKNIRVIRIDDGVRLLDGTLAAHLDNNRFILDSLRFPARLRVTPKEWRTNEWVTTNPDAKNGSLTLSGNWDLLESVGSVNIDLYRYPLLQRTDRYAMVTGKLKIDAPLPALAITGELTADAGWFDLDMLSTIPTLDSDVVVIRPGQTKKVNVPMDISLDLKVGLGPRFYITGYGVNSGLVGDMQIIMSKGKLSANGALRTRGGAIEAYGQRLQLRRGTITFQGDITSPVLNIEALRTGVAVEAGVRVAGTAKRPRIDLVSYPEVSEVEKLSWLLLGRGPDDSGGDAALLFSVGTSFLGSGEPFYRKFGLDEVSMRTGALGSTGSILPPESVVRGLNSGTSDIENQFVVASKKLSSGITLSIEQALSDTGTVGRASYQLARGLSADITAGTVNGIALIYRIFSRD